MNRKMLVGLVLAVALTAGASPPAAAGWRIDGGYLDNAFDTAQNGFKDTVRFIWTAEYPPGTVEYFFFAACFRFTEFEDDGSNKIIFKKIKVTGLDSATKVNVPNLKGQLDDGDMDFVFANVPALANLAGESGALVEAQVIVKGPIGAGDGLRCELDVTEDTFAAASASRARRR